MTHGLKTGLNCKTMHHFYFGNSLGLLFLAITNKVVFSTSLPATIVSGRLKIQLWQNYKDSSLCIHTREDDSEAFMDPFRKAYQSNKSH